MRLCKFALLLVISAALISCGHKDKAARKIFDDGSTPVERHGALRVVGKELCDKNGSPVQLCGISSHGLHWHGKYANENVLRWLRDDFNADLWRAALYTAPYVSNKALYSKISDSVEAAKKLGLYVIVDWHVIDEHDPLLYADEAAAFFERVASTYSDCPNIIYEICNEPNGKAVTWEGNIKPYAERIIPIIRKHCDNIIVVGTPDYSGDLKSVWKSPILGQENIMYCLHFYAGTHGANYRKQIKGTRRRGLPVFVTEWGTTQASGDGGVFEKETLKWINFMAANNISWANWSVNNKGEDSGILKFNKDRDAKGGWQESDLQPSGILVRRILRGE